MNAGRWYPTTTTLPNGDMLVVSGDMMPGMLNRLSQVYDSDVNSWRDLTNAEFPWPLYPFMFVAPDGTVFSAGAQRDSLFIDTTPVAGSLLPGPLSSTVRSDGSAVQYADGKILILGGSDGLAPPTATAEVIDLTVSDPEWSVVGSMSH